MSTGNIIFAQIFRHENYFEVFVFRFILCCFFFASSSHMCACPAAFAIASFVSSRWHGSIRELVAMFSSMKVAAFLISAVQHSQLTHNLMSFG